MWGPNWTSSKGFLRGSFDVSSAEGG